MVGMGIVVRRKQNCRQRENRREELSGSVRQRNERNKLKQFMCSRA